MSTSCSKIVALGDSITYGFPYWPDYSWVHLAAGELGIQILNKGVNGDTTRDMLKRFAADVLVQRPSHVIILGGANDAFEQVAAQTVTGHIRQMVKMAVGHAIVPFVGLPTPCNFAEEALLEEYRQSLRQYAADESTDLIDFYSGMLAPTGSGIRAGLHVDGIHPSEDGYRVMAGLAVEFLRNRLELLSKSVVDVS